jgi:glycosyltransferase involved in cell wall biosynthesis
MPRVSVIIPFRDRVFWLRDAVASVLAQSYRDFELIVVDDGSTEILDASALRDARIRYIRQEHAGRVAARNRGLAEATGDYLAFLDADDVFAPQKLERQVALMDEHPQAVLSHTSYVRVTESLDPLEYRASGTFTGRVFPRILRNCPIAMSTVVISRARVEGELRFEEIREPTAGEDVILWVRLAQSGEVLGIDEPLSQVRIHSANAALDPEPAVAARLNLLNSSVLNAMPLRRSQVRAWMYFDRARLAIARRRSSAAKLG